MGVGSGDPSSRSGQASVGACPLASAQAPTGVDGEILHGSWNWGTEGIVGDVAHGI